MKPEHYKQLIIVFLAIIIVYLFFSMYCNDLEKFQNLFSNTKPIHLDTNKCSQQCCKHTQWPVPFNTKDPNTKDEFDEYVGSNFTCNRGDGGGCLCVKKTDLDYLSNRGQ
jgi:hypothetical protein